MADLENFKAKTACQTHKNALYYASINETGDIKSGHLLNLKSDAALPQCH